MLSIRTTEIKFKTSRYNSSKKTNIKKILIIETESFITHHSNIGTKFEVGFLMLILDYKLIRGINKITGNRSLSTQQPKGMNSADRCIVPKNAFSYLA